MVKRNMVSSNFCKKVCEAIDCRVFLIEDRSQSNRRHTYNYDKINKSIISMRLKRIGDRRSRDHA